MVFSGTIRTFDSSVRREIHAKIRSIVENVSESMGAKGFVEIDPGVPVTFNDVDLAEALVPSLESVYGSSNVFQSPRITGAEDFSFFQEESKVRIVPENTASSGTMFILTPAEIVPTVTTAGCWVISI